MRQLTFPGFLNRYVRDLSTENTGALYSLVDETMNGNYRLKEPLFLYALATGREKTLLKAAKGSFLEKEYEQLRNRYSYPDLLKAFQMVPCDLPDGYQKVWRSYVSEVGAYERDCRVKELMRKRIVALQEEKHIRTYRISKDLQLNNSNINAWLKNGNETKAALGTARRILDYLEKSAVKIG